MSCLAEGTLDEAVGEVLEDALEELYWVTKLPGSVLNMPAPDVEPAGGDQ